MQQDFWDEAWTTRRPRASDVEAYIEADAGMSALLDRAGDLSGKRVLDLGCGDGYLSVAAAQRGAQVVAVDTSQAAVEATKMLAEHNDAGDLVSSHRLDAMHLDRLDASFDLAMGKYVLHHIEPFSTFTAVLFGMLKKDGRGVFYENNARNPLLMFARRYLAGRLGIPKYGDDEEYPFEPREVEMLRRQFAWVRVHYPELAFFRMANTYFFQHQAKYRRITDALIALDDWLYENVPALRPYSYHQIVEFGK